MGLVLALRFALFSYVAIVTYPLILMGFLIGWALSGLVGRLTE